MRISELIPETINPDILSPEFEHEQQIGDYLYTAKTRKSYTGVVTYLMIRCYDGTKLIGNVNFEVRMLAGKKWLESQQTQVEGGYTNKGIASTMYAYAKMLGNDVKPSPYQSDDGKAMWKAWKKSGAAKHLTTESVTGQVLYHGGQQPITQFKIPAYGVFFSPHKDWAEHYGPVITPVNVNANKVYAIDYTHDIDMDIVDALFDRDYKTVAKFVKLLQAQGYQAMQSVSDSEMVVVFPGTAIQVLDSTQR